MVKLDVVNSRMKDFYDVWLLARQFDFDGPTLTDAISKTFDRRGTTIPTDVGVLLRKVAAYTGKQAQWRGFIRRNPCGPHRRKSISRRFRSFARN
jgi:hypothetical protein